MLLGYLPSPSRGVWHLGPLPVRAYALCILAGIVVAVLLTQRRWVARGGSAEQVLDVAVWAVPFGLTGGRLIALCVAAYTSGRLWIELLRVDHANHILGLRLNTWTCLAVLLAATAYLIRSRRPLAVAKDG